MPQPPNITCKLPKPKDIEEHWAPVAGGRMRYLEAGAGHPLLLVHGIAASSFSFRLNWPELAASHHRVIVPDLLNVGYSDRVTGLDSSLRGTAMRLRDFLDQIGIAQADILGSSHGGSVVMELAGIGPERFRSMVLVSPANLFAHRYDRILRFYLTRTGNLFMRIVPFMPGVVWNRGIGRMYADPSRMVAGTGIGYARPLRVRGTIRHILSSLSTFVADLEAHGASLPEMSKIPTLLIWGDRDPVVELESGYRLQEALGAKMTVMSGVGHLPYEESPEEFNRIVLKWLKRDIL